MDLVGAAATLLLLLAVLPSDSAVSSDDQRPSLLSGHDDDDAAAVQSHRHHDADNDDDDDAVQNPRHHDDDGGEDLLDVDDVEEELWLLGDANVTYSGSQLREEGRKKIKLKKFKLKKLLFPLLMAYKLKFFALVPLLVSGLVLLVGTTGMAGFFFALFAATISIKSNKW